MRVLAVTGSVLNVDVETVQPDAPTLVFVNSLGTDFRIWDGVVVAFRGRYNMVRHDKRGHGLSSITAGGISIEEYANDLDELLKTIGAKRIVLCGLSVGGLIAQQVLVNGKTKVDGLILSNTGLKIGNEAMWNSRIEGIEAQGLDGIADGVMERWFSPAFRSEKPEMLKLYRTMLSRQPTSGYVGCCKAIRDHAGFDHSQRKVPPTLCIGGGLDGSTPPALVQAMAAGITGAKYVEFTGTGHLPCIEQPARYAEIVAEFVNAL